MSDKGASPGDKAKAANQLGKEALKDAMHAETTAEAEAAKQKREGAKNLAGEAVSDAGQKVKEKVSDAAEAVKDAVTPNKEDK